MQKQPLHDLIEPWTEGNFSSGQQTEALLVRSTKHPSKVENVLQVDKMSKGCSTMNEEQEDVGGISNGPTPNHYDVRSIKIDIPNMDIHSLQNN